MDSIFKEKEAPFSHSCPQRPLLWHLHPLCISNLLYPPHQNPNSSTISQLDDSLFVGIEVGQSMVVDDPDGRFGVTAFDANHCPGI
ncbi:hypothetical protein CK203_036025 [Vitis vinifera]|uniref:Uncharacterized protein n=1 Tax=Vitis vinifera TaxID=29760 RepID=A0A438HQX9_VITVI|nr:hypothetical protein CK203_036025 [Vitis vinifera]